MRQIDIQQICQAVRRGAHISIGRNHYGRTRLKLQSGPFGIFVRRYEVTDDQVAMIKEQLYRSTHIPDLGLGPKLAR